MRKPEKPTAIKLAVLAAILVFLFSAPTYIGLGSITVMTLVFIYMAFGQMWNFLAGFTGLVSLGNQIFIGFGGYSLAIVSQKLGMPIPLGILTGGVVSVIFALIISVPVFKMRGVFFTIGTWIIAETLLVIFGGWNYIGK